MATKLLQQRQAHLITNRHQKGILNLSKSDRKIKLSYISHTTYMYDRSRSFVQQARGIQIKIRQLHVIKITLILQFLFNNTIKVPILD
jgi:hypothetical protein